MIQRSLTLGTAWIFAAVVTLFFTSEHAQAAEQVDSLSSPARAISSTIAYVPLDYTQNNPTPAAVAQAATPTATVSATPAATLTITPTTTATPGPTLAAPIGLISPTLALTATATVTTINGTDDPELPVASTTVVTSPTIPALQVTPTPVAAQNEDDDEIEPLEGTIIANRSEYAVQFFLEGQTIEISAQRSTSFELPRATSVLNLYNCAATTPESNDNCYWDPYVLQRDGFYEIYESGAVGTSSQIRLLLRNAGAPPTDQVWVQNRTNSTESIVFRNETIELVPTAIHELAVEAGLPAILYVRSCITLEGQMACEWLPKSLEAGNYYALVETQVSGAVANSTVTNVDLRPVVGDGSGELQTASDEVLCRVLVPTLNIRSGPGLQYQIIGKIFSTDTDPGTVLVVGRNADSQWLTVDESVMPNGWVTASNSFLLCDEDVSPLPVVEAPPLPIEVEPPTPVVVDPAPAGPSDQQPQETADTDAPADSETDAAVGDDPAETPVAGQTPTEGYGLFVVHNGFEHEIRFTIDQQYRPDAGASEIDLQPGQSISFVVFPGSVAFSVSSPWRGLSGNALVNIDADETMQLWVRFMPDNGDDSSWRLAWD